MLAVREALGKLFICCDNIVPGTLWTKSKSFDDKFKRQTGALIQLIIKFLTASMLRLGFEPWATRYAEGRDEFTEQCRHQFIEDFVVPKLVRPLICK